MPITTASRSTWFGKTIMQSSDDELKGKLDPIDDQKGPKISGYVNVFAALSDVIAVRKIIVETQKKSPSLIIYRKHVTRNKVNDFT